MAFLFKFDSIILRRSASIIKFKTHLNYPACTAPLCTAASVQEEDDGMFLIRHYSSADVCPKDEYTEPDPFPHYSASEVFSNQKTAEEKLLKIVESKIYAARDFDPDNGVKVPRRFPFTIEDNPGRAAIILRRTFYEEEIKVVAERTYRSPGPPFGHNKIYAPLNVSVTKKNGFNLEFSCLAYWDDICIKKIVKYPNSADGPRIVFNSYDFRDKDLDETQKKAFKKYSEVRGIGPCLTKFLHKYMAHKDERDKLLWLKNVKKFIEA